MSDKVYLGQATMPVVVDETLSDTSTNPVQNQAITNRINEIELYKTPNLSITGSPTVTQGQVSNFSDSNYMQFPFALDLSEATSISIIMAFTTGSNVTTQENILDSYYGIAVAISSGKFVLALGSTGSSWDIANGVSGTATVEAETTYFVRISWDGTNYILSYSTDAGDTWTDDITVVSSTVLYETQVYIGGSPDLFGAGTAKPFSGTINLNSWVINYNGQLFWQGMDDAGLATRANVDLSNLSDTGKAYVHRYATSSAIGGIKQTFDASTGTWTVITEDL